MVVTLNKFLISFAHFSTWFDYKSKLLQAETSRFWRLERFGLRHSREWVAGLSSDGFIVSSPTTIWDYTGRDLAVAGINEDLI